MRAWVKTQIKGLFASSIPGEWGLEGSPEDGIPVLRSTNFRNDGSIDYSDMAYRTIQPSRLTKRRIVNGTILIEKSGGSPTQAAGRIVYCDRDFNGTASNFIEVVNVKHDLAPKYVAYLLFHLYQCGLVLKYQQQTTGIINFKLNQYVEEYVTLPSQSPEQVKIAEILSTVDRAIEQTEALIAKQERIKTGLMQDLLTRGIDERGNLRSESTHQFKNSPLGRIPTEWHIQELIQCADRLVVGLASSTTHAYRDTGVPLIRNQNIRRGYFDARELLFLDPDFASRFPNKATRLNDVLTVRTGANVGDTAMLPDGLVGTLTFTTLITSTILSKLHPAYLVWFIQSPLGQSELNRILVGGGKENLNVGEFVHFRIILPPLKEQEFAIQCLDLIRTGIIAEEASLTKYRKLKAALMQDLLTGRKRVTSLLELESTR